MDKRKTDFPLNVKNSNEYMDWYPVTSPGGSYLTCPMCETYTIDDMPLLIINYRNVYMCTECKLFFSLAEQLMRPIGPEFVYRPEIYIKGVLGESKNRHILTASKKFESASKDEKMQMFMKYLTDYTKVELE